MTDEERDLMRRFEAEAARIEVPPRARRKPARAGWPLLAPAAATIGVVIVALALGRTLGDLRSPSPVTGNVTTATPTLTAQPTPAPSLASPSTSPSATVLAAPSGPFLVGTAAGGVYTLEPSGLSEQIFDCEQRAVSVLERSPDGQSLFVMCSDATLVGEGYVWTSGSQPRAIPLSLIPHSASWSADSRSVALLVPGACAPTAPVCAARIVSYEIASGTVTTLREDDVLTENLRWTRFGLTYYRTGTPSGSYLLEAGTWRRIADDPIVTEAADGRLLLDRTVYDAGRERHLVVVQMGTTETILTPGGASERALAFDTAGRVVALREEPGGGTSVVLYEAGRAISVTAGDFGPLAVQWNEWLLSRTHGNTIAFFSLDARQFASPAVRLDQTATVTGLRPE